MEHLLNKEFIKKSGLKIAGDCADKNDISIIETFIDITFGNQAREYLLSYGGLSKKTVELLGVSKKKFLSSDMIRETLKLLDKFPELKGYAVVYIENVRIQGKNIERKYLINKDDNIFVIFGDMREPKPILNGTGTAVSFEEFVVKLFASAKEN